MIRYSKMVEVRPIANNKATRIFVFEQDEIYRYLYDEMATRYPVQLLAVCPDLSPSSIRDRLAIENVDVLVIGSKKLDPKLIDEVAQLRKDKCGMGLVLLFASYRTPDLGRVRQLLRKGQGGTAIFLRQSLGQLDQLLNIIDAAGHGHIVIDPALSGLIVAQDSGSSFLKQMTGKEIETLNLLASGFTNAAIAKAQCVDVKTVEHHLNNIYGKLRADDDFDGKHHLRVEAARLYLRETHETVSTT